MSRVVEVTEAIVVEKCKICGQEFKLSKARHYISRDEGRTGLTAALAGCDEYKIYDTFDCPHCGCQHIAQERKREYTVAPEDDIDDGK